MNELIQSLVEQLGVKPDQAKGGAGLLFKVVQSKLGGDFSKVTDAIPDVMDMIKSAPEEGGAVSMLGGLASAIGGDKADGLAGLASLAGGFSKLDLDSGMIQKFIPIVLSFLQNKGGGGLVELVTNALK